MDGEQGARLITVIPIPDISMVQQLCQMLTSILTEDLAITDPTVLESVFITLDRKSGTGALSAAVLGSKATLRITAPVDPWVTP